MEYLVYGLPKGETERYTEQLLGTDLRNQSQIQQIIDAAKRDGWHSFRVATYNGEPPNFVKALNL